MNSSEIVFIFFYLRFTWLSGWWHHKRILKKTASFEVWLLVFFKSVKNHSPKIMHFHPWKEIQFHKYCLLIGFNLTKYSFYCIWRILKPFLWTLTYEKGNMYLKAYFLPNWVLTPQKKNSCHIFKMVIFQMQMKNQKTNKMLTVFI